jgi:molybdenum cofactor biosynthesis enzyme
VLAAPSGGLQALLDDKQLSVNVSIQPATDLVVSQQVLLNIEVATTSWFASGTKIGLFEIDDVVVLRREKFANNSTKRENGQTWVVQVWTIALYPQRQGTFIVPEIELDLAIADGAGAEIEGTVKTLPISFTAMVPASLSQQDRWVATSQLQVQQRLSRDISNLRVGDAVVRTIELKAQDITAMMLPAISAESYDVLAVYDKLPKVEDSVNRGMYLARRSQELTYVAEKQGEYIIPALDFYWWDTTSQSVKVEELAELTLQVGEGAPIEGGAVEGNSNRITEQLLNNKALIIKALVLLVLGVAVILIAKKLVQLVKRCKPARKINLEKDFQRACKKSDISGAINLMYLWLEQDTEDVVAIREFEQYKNDESFKQLFNQLMQALVAKDKTQKINIKDFATKIVSLHQAATKDLIRKPKLGLHLN